MKTYADRLKAGIEIEKPIAVGILKIKAKLGELMPAKPPGERGQGRGGNKSSRPDELDFAKETIAAYRKIAANKSTPMKPSSLSTEQSTLQALALDQLQAVLTTLETLQDITDDQADREAVQDAVSNTANSQELLRDWFGGSPVTPYDD